MKLNLKMMLEPRRGLVWLVFSSLVVSHIVAASNISNTNISTSNNVSTTTNATKNEDSFTPLFQQPTRATTPSPDPPRLSGRHFKITAVEFEDYTRMEIDPDTGDITFSGFLVDILREIAREDRANFTYELLPPSGFGSGCGDNRLNYSNHKDHNDGVVFGQQFWQSYNCAESDVNDRPQTNYTTDFYWGLFFVTPKRQKVNQFTVALDPPGSGALTLIGPLTGISGTDDLIFHNPRIPLCGYAGTAFTNLLNATFPDLNLRLIHDNSAEATHRAFEDGLCEAAIVTRMAAQIYISSLQKLGKCSVRNDGNKPIGIIGKPLSFGLKNFAFGIRDDIDSEVVNTINFWLQALMTCFPQDPDGYCPSVVVAEEDLMEGVSGSTSTTTSSRSRSGSIVELYNQYSNLNSNGDECGYVQYPTEPYNQLSALEIAALVIVPMVLVIVLAIFIHRKRMKLQQKRTKKRFVQQIARNIEIHPNVRNIPAEKLSGIFSHIGGSDGLICKDDLSKWMNDLQMEFMTESDFEILWNLLDADNTGHVDPIDFISFLKDCAPQFQEVHKEYSELPKSERLKLASRRLSNISRMGEEGVRKMERRNNKRSREYVLPPQSPGAKKTQSLPALLSPSELSDTDVMIDSETSSATRKLFGSLEKVISRPGMNQK